MSPIWFCRREAGGRTRPDHRILGALIDGHLPVSSTVELPSGHHTRATNTEWVPHYPNQIVTHHRSGCTLHSSEPVTRSGRRPTSSVRPMSRRPEEVWILTRMPVPAPSPILSRHELDASDNSNYPIRTTKSGSQQEGDRDPNTVREHTNQFPELQALPCPSTDDCSTPTIGHHPGDPHPTRTTSPLFADELRKQLANDPEETGPTTEDGYTDWLLSVTPYIVEAPYQPPTTDPTRKTDTLHTLVCVVDFATTDLYIQKVREAGDIDTSLQRVLRDALLGAIQTLIPDCPIEEMEATATLFTMNKVTLPAVTTPAP